MPTPHSSCREPGGRAQPLCSPGHWLHSPGRPHAWSLPGVSHRHLLDSRCIQQIGQARPVDLQVLQGRGRLLGWEEPEAQS